MKFRDQIRTNAQIYVKTQKGKTTVQERELHYNSDKITMMVP